MKISAAEVRRRLPVGTECTVEFIGVNRKFCPPGNERTRRRIEKQTVNQMKSRFLNGPKEGNNIWLNWLGVKAEDQDGAIILSDDQQGEFLKIETENCTATTTCEPICEAHIA